MNYKLLFDGNRIEEVKEKILPLVRDIISSSEFFDSDSDGVINSDEQLLLYLSDEQLKQLFLKIAGKNIKIAILPHPEATESCRGIGVQGNIDKAVSHLKSEPESIKMDILYCNGQPVFNSMVIGNTFKLTSEDSSNNKSFFRRLLHSFTRFSKIQPFRVDVELQNDKSINTSVAGIVVSEHRKSSLLSIATINNSSLNDGKLHAFFISPRSIMEMFRYAIMFSAGTKKLPSFAAHIKTSSIQFTFPDGERDYIVDKLKLRSDKIKLHVEKNQLEIIPGSIFEMPDTNPDTNDILKISALPDSGTAQILANKKVPLVRNASTEEFKDLFQVLRENARLKGTYLTLMVLSTILATFGLFANSAPVVIGAMILAPLMSPIISLSMGTLRQDKKLITGSFTTIMAGLGISLVFAVLITLLTPIQTAGSEILARTRPNLLDLGIAVVSGIAGAYAHAREEVAKTLAGVAIAVALIPPLAVTAIGIGWADSEIFLGAALLLTTNLAGMVLAASLTFMFLGFSPLKLAGKGMLVSTILVLILCIPLALGFNEMVAEYNVIKHVESIKTENMHIRDVKVINHRPMKLSIKLVSEQYVSDDELDKVKMLIQEEIMHEVELEIVVAVRK